MSDLTNELRAEQGTREKLNIELRRYRPQLEANPEDTYLGDLVRRLESAEADTADRIGELESELHVEDDRRSVLSDLSQRLRGVEEGAGFGSPRSRPLDPQHRSLYAFDESQRCIEGALRAGELTSVAVDYLDSHLREGDPVGSTAQYVAAAGQGAYRSAFGKLLQYGNDAGLRLTNEERSALEQVTRAEQYRALAEGTGSLGGWALPITIDPSITLMSNGAINPLRQLAEVRTVTTLETRLLTSDGTTASYAAEATEASDNSPTFAQPDLFVERAQSFIPFSFELGMDWPSLQNDLAKLFADAKDVLEATKFWSGAGHGSFEPQGLLTGLSSSYSVASAGTAALATGDVYALMEAVPTRFQPNTQFVASVPLIHKLYRLVPRASTTDPTLVSDDLESILGMPLSKFSTMPSTITTGSSVMVAGDFNAGFVIADRIGMAVELIPNLFGPNRRPTGQRGMFCYWRNTSIVRSSNDNAPLRLLTIS